MSRIAFVSPDVRIYTADSQGASQRALSGADLSCTWPTWSPDGLSVAFSGYRSGNNGHGSLGVFVGREDGTPPKQVYANEPGTDAIAQGTPHYTLWSPDSAKLAFIAQTVRGGLTLFLHDAVGQGPPRRIMDGGPLYISWSPDSQYLVAHAHQLHYLIKVDDVEVSQIPVMSSLYMAPSWSPVASEMAICGELTANRQALLIADTEDGRARMVAEIDGAASFIWRPDGRKIAVARDLNRNEGYYGGLWELRVDGSDQETQLTDDPVLCFFWSPDGAKIAYVTSSERGDGSIRWAVLDMESRAVNYLADFQPSREQLTMFMFFDQYSQSHSPWSPDRRHLIFAGVLGYQEARTQLPDGATSIYVAEVDGTTPPIQITRGKLGVWSPVE